MQRIILGTIIISLMGCSTQMSNQPPVAIKKALNQAANDALSQPTFQLPAAVNADLMPALEAGDFQSTSALEKRFRVNARNVDANAFFSSLVQGTPFNIVIHPGVSGLISLQLKDVTLNEVLNVVDDVYGYSTTRKGNIIQVFPATLRTDIIPVDYLQLQRQGVSLTSITTGSIANEGTTTSSSDSGSATSTADASTTTGGTTIKTTSESDFWQQLEKVVRGMIGHGEGRNVMVSPQAGLISVRAFPNELREVKQFLGMSQQRLVRQVVLEAKIMEVTLNDSYQQGINWQSITGSIGGTNIVVGSTPIVGAAAIAALPGGNTISNLLGGQTNITISDGNFTSVLSFLETQGNLNVLSSPRVTAANNQKAVIKVGGDEYFVTNVSSSNVSGDNSTAAPDIELTPFFSGISLDVTPQIDDQGGVLLHVHPAVVDIKNEIKAVDLGEKFGIYKLPLAKSTIRESDSIIHARSGDVVVIGGLMKTVMTDQVSKVPLLGDIPVIGNLFRNINKVKQKTELVILLKPTVISDQTWQKEIERSRSLISEWFPEDE